MGAPPLTTHKPIWMFRSDDADLTKLKNLLGLRDGRTVSIPEAIGEAIRIAVAEMSSIAHGYPRQDGFAAADYRNPPPGTTLVGPRTWQPGYEPPAGATVLGPFTVGEKKTDAE